jgi:hypothetical protein
MDGRTVLDQYNACTKAAKKQAFFAKSRQGYLDILT